MEKDLRMSSASGSRNTDLLSKTHWLKQVDGTPRPGLNLIIKQEDLANRRRQLLYLTSKGKQLIKEFKQILYPPIE